MPGRAAFVFRISYFFMKTLSSLTATVLAAGALQAQNRVVEKYDWSDPEGRLMGYYSAAIAFSPVGVVPGGPAWSGAVGVELSYIPPLSRAQRTGGFQKTESTNLAPVLPRPRAALTLPGGATLEASWVPPVKAFGVTANLVSGALAVPVGAVRGVALAARVNGSTGRVTGPITCNDDVRDTGSGGQDYFRYVCHNRESEDRFEPRALGAELVASSRAARGRAVLPYAGLGVRTERNRFDVGVICNAPGPVLDGQENTSLYCGPTGSRDPYHPILETSMTRGYGFAGATWLAPAGVGRTALSGELFYAPGSLLTGRMQVSVHFRGAGAR